MFMSIQMTFSEVMVDAILVLGAISPPARRGWWRTCDAKCSLDEAKRSLTDASCSLIDASCSVNDAK
jgi:hypothetical protein